MKRKMNVSLLKKTVIACLLILACLGLLSGCKKEAEAVSEETAESTFKVGISYESFTDVESHSAKDYIKVMSKLGIARGRTDTEFAPDENVTRAEFMEMVAYASGLTDAAYKDAYKDVTAEMEYAGILQAAYDAGIIDANFVTGDSFNGEDIITREEMASMMAAGYRVLTGEEADETALSQFVESDPQGNMTRAEAVVMLYDLQDCGDKLIRAGFDENISDWGTKIRTGTTQQGYENGAGQALWSETEGNAAPGCMLFDMEYTGKKQINAFQWDYTFASEDDSNIIEEGATYMITLFAKVEGAEKVKLNVIKLRHENDNEMNYSTVVDTQELSGEGWRLYCFELTATTSINEAKLLFQAGGCENYNTKIYIDDISLQKFEAKVNVKVDVEDEYKDVAVVSGVGTYGPYEEATLMAAGKKVELIKEGNWFQQILNFFIRLFNKQEAEYYLADCWYDTTYGNRIAQGSMYDFTVKSNTELQVKYQKYDVNEQEWELEASGKVPKMTMKDAERSKDSVTVSARVQLPEEYSLVDCGVLYYEGAYAENYNIFTDGATAVSATEISDKGGYEVEKTKIPSDTDVLVKAYAICKDTDENYIVLYSDEKVCLSEEKRTEIDYKLIYNFELMNCFKDDYASEEGGYEAVWSKYISQLVDTDVDMITLTPSSYRSNLWQSKVDTHWTEYAPTQEETDFGLYERGKDYILAGGDPLQDMLDYCEEYGFENVFINYRMNDQHKTDIENFATHNQFYLEHPEYWLNPTSTTNNRTLNYMEPEVREYYFGLVEELCTNYDIDGLELDFERAPIFFKDEEVEAGTEIMTDFVGRVRAMLDRVGEEKGKYLPLSVRVCDSLEESLSVGLDVQKWDELGYIDIVNTTSSYRQTLAVDTESYTDVLSENAKVYVEMQYLVDQSTTNTTERVFTTAECLKATAENYYARGVDGISAFNMDYSGNIERTLEGLIGITDAEVLKNSEKHYVMINGYDMSTVSGVTSTTTIMPIDNTLYDSALLRVETAENSRNTELEVYFNGTKLEMPKTITLTDETELFPRLADTDAYAKAECLQYFTLPTELVQNGENTIEVKYVSGDICVVRVVEVGLYHKDSYALQGEARDPKTIKSNMLANGGFESGDSKWTATFKEQFQASGTVSYPETGGVNDGGHLCFDIKNAGNTVGAIQLFQTMKTAEITAGKTYRLTFSAKVSGTSSMNIGRIWLRNLEEEGVTLGEVRDVEVRGSSWKTYTVDILAVESSSGARLLLDMGGDGATNIQLCLDNISLIELDGQTAVAEEQVNANSLLINGGFGKLGASWTAINNIGTYKWLTEGGVDNSGCLLYNITSSSNGNGKEIGDLQLYQILKDVKVEAGKTYRFTFQAKLEGAESMTLGKIWIRNNETTSVELGVQKNIQISGSKWTTYTVDIPVTEDCTGIRMLLQMGGGVTVAKGKTVKLYLDHLCLVDNGKTPVTSESNALIENGGFDDGDSKWTVNFKENLQALGTATYPVTGGVGNGAYLCLDIKNAGNTAGAIQLFQTMKTAEITAGKTYRLTFSAKVSGTSSMNIGRIWLRNLEEEGVTLGEVRDVEVRGSSWKTYTVDILAVESSSGARLLLDMGGDGATNIQLCLDNISLIELDGQTAVAEEQVNANSLLINGGFGKLGASWTAINNIGTYKWLTEGGVDNSGCLLYNITSSSNGNGKEIGDLQLYQILKDVKVEAGKTYRFTFQAKLEGAESMTLGKIWIRNNETTSVELGVQKNIQISGSKWTTYTVDIPVTEDCTGIRMLLQMGGGVTVAEGKTVKLYLDHLCLVDNGKTPASSGNGSNESGSNQDGTIEQVNELSLLTNGGFGKDGESWTVVNKIGSYEWLTEGGVDNSNCLLYNITSSSNGTGSQIGDLQLYQILKDVSVEAGKTYRLTFQAKLEGAESMELGKIWIRNNEATAVELGGQTKIQISGSEWATYTVDIPVTEDCTGIRMLLQMGGGVTVAEGETVKLYLDHLCLLDNGETPTTGGDDSGESGGSGQEPEEDTIEQVNELSLLVNGGFGKDGESWTATNKIGTYEWLTEGGVDNSNCLLYNITSSSSGATKVGDLQLYQILKTTKVEAGKTYRLTFQAKLEGAESMELGKIWIRNNEATAVELGGQTKIQISGSEWATYTVDIPVTEDCTGIRMLLQMGGGVTVAEGETVKLYVDHLCLLDNGETPSTDEEDKDDSGESGGSEQEPEEDTIEQVNELSLLVNGGFGKDGESWTAVNKIGTYEWLTEGGVDNSNCLLYNITSSSNGTGSQIGDLQLYQILKNVTVEAGKTYRLTFQAKLEGVESMELGKIWIRNNGTTAVELGAQKKIQISGSEWTTYTVDITVSEDSDGIRMMLQIGGGVTVPDGETVKLYLDHLCLLEKEEPSVLVNGELESKASWSAIIDTGKAAAGTISWLTNGGVDDSGCLYYEITNAGSAVNALYLLQNVTDLTVIEGETYELTFWAKVENAESWNIGQVWLRNSGSAYIELTNMSSVTISGEQWMQYSVTLTIKTTNTGVRLLLQMGNGCTVPEGTTVKLYFDNIELRKIGEAPIRLNYVMLSSAPVELFKDEDGEEN